MAIQRPGQGFQRPGVPFGPPGSPVTGGPVANRYTRTRTRPVNPPGIVRPPGIAPGLPVTPPMPGIRPMPNPGMPGGKIDIGGPIAGGPNPRGDFFDSPEYKNLYKGGIGDFIDTMDIYTSPYFGPGGGSAQGSRRDRAYEAYLQRTGQQPGYGINKENLNKIIPALFQPGGPSQQPTNPGITNPNVSIGTPVQQPGMTPIYNNTNTSPSEVLKPGIVGYRDPSGQYYNLQGQKQSMAIPGSTTPDMRNFEFLTKPGPGLPQPQLEAMPYTGNPAYQPTQATQQNPNASIGFGGGIGSVFGAPFSGIGSAFTQASQQPNMSEKDTQALQGFGQAFSNLGSSFASTMGSAMPLLGGKSQPAQPGMGQANQTGPMSGGFNPSLGNTTLPGNF